MKEKPITPYQRLMNSFKAYVDGVEYRHSKTMFVYKKARLSEGWALEQLYERVAAAAQLGYDVQLHSTDDGLEVQYIKKVPNRPWNV